MDKLFQFILSQLLTKAGSTAGEKLAQLIFQFLTGQSSDEQVIDALTAINNNIDQLQNQIKDLPDMINYNTVYNNIVNRNSALTAVLFSVNQSTQSLELNPVPSFTMDNFNVMNEAISRASSDTDYFTLSNDMFNAAYGLDIDTCIEQADPTKAPYFTKPCALLDVNNQTLLQLPAGTQVDFNQYFQNLLFLNCFTVLAVGAYVATVQQAYIILLQANGYGILQQVFDKDSSDLAKIQSNISNQKISNDLLTFNMSMDTCAFYKQIFPYMLTSMQILTTPGLYNFYSDFASNGAANIYLSNLRRARDGNSSYLSSSGEVGVNNSGYSVSPFALTFVNVNYSNGNDIPGNSVTEIQYIDNDFRAPNNKVGLQIYTDGAGLDLSITINPSITDATCQFNIHVVTNNGEVCITLVNAKYNTAIVNCIEHEVFSSDPQYVGCYQFDAGDADHCWVVTYAGS